MAVLENTHVINIHCSLSQVVPAGTGIRPNESYVFEAIGTLPDVLSWLNAGGELEIEARVRVRRSNIARVLGTVWG